MTSAMAGTSLREKLRCLWTSTSEASPARGGPAGGGVARGQTLTPPRNQGHTLRRGTHPGAEWDPTAKGVKTLSAGLRPPMKAQEAAGASRPGLAGPEPGGHSVGDVGPAHSLTHPRATGTRGCLRPLSKNRPQPCRPP